MPAAASVARPSASARCTAAASSAWVFALRSAARASEWRDGVALWSALARETPNDYRPYSNAATHWIDRERFDEAYNALQRAQALAPRDAAVRTNLAVVSLHRTR